MRTMSAVHHGDSSVSRWLRPSLSIFFLVLFVAALIGQALAGWAQFNDQQTAHHLAEISLGRYLRSADFAADVTENWQSEYLQILLYGAAAVFFVGRGSESSAQFGRARTAVYSWAAGVVVATIFIGSWVVQSVAGWSAFNETRMQRLQDPVSWTGYLGNPDFWARTLQNWQSEFLAVGSFAALAILSRRRATAQSHPGDERHGPRGPSAG
nr:hypothetical protein [Aeromicrobium sp.]